MLLALDVEIPGRDANRQSCRKKEDRVEEQRKPVDPYHAGEAVNGDEILQSAKIKRASHRNELGA